MTDELEKVIHENFNSCRGRGGVSPKALAEVIESSDWLRKVKADAFDEGFSQGHYVNDSEDRDCGGRENPYRD